MTKPREPEHVRHGDVGNDARGVHVAAIPTGGGTSVAPGDAAAAESVDPTIEDRYWREQYSSRPYADETLGYDQYRSAYRYGWESRERLRGRRWDEVERELERGWRGSRGGSRLGWPDARLAARDAWQRVDRNAAQRDRVAE